MKVADFDFELPEDRIAQTPIEPRDHSRLMVVHRHQTEIEHKSFYNIIDYLNPNDVLVVNDSRVIPARLFGRRVHTGGKVEFLLLRPMSDKSWEVLVKPGRRAQVGTEIEFGGLLNAKVIDTTEVGGRIVEFQFDGDFQEILHKLGETPLPPYITEKLEDKERYQTVYSRDLGSVAAPTAGLHFTEELLTKIREKGVRFAPLTLHVGLGTFRPVAVDEVEDHTMHAEYYHLSPESARLINECKQGEGRVIAVGTTAVRTLETLGTADGTVESKSGWTDIFIYPGYQFNVVDAMITNFHLPKSSLIMLVSAFAGQNTIQNAYAQAIADKYRFYSFGDAMLLI